MAILADLSRSDLEAMVAKLQAERGGVARKLSLKVSAKGAISLYGLGRWPVTLYAEQWERVLSMSEAITAFAKANASALSTKEASEASEA